MDIDLGEITEVNEENDSMATKIRPFARYKKMNPEVHSKFHTSPFVNNKQNLRPCIKKSDDVTISIAVVSSVCQPDAVRS